MIHHILYITYHTLYTLSIGKLAGANLAHVTSELGGKAALIVFPDCNLDQAVNGAAFATFIASGMVHVQIDTS
ncbi:aldehyde dehydrogenase family protein [archaeon]|nr:MAG: aldehyde dehydrogenase family protein [archaeon]